MKKGEPKGQLEYNLKATKMFEKIHGEDHPLTQTSYENISVTSALLGDLDKA